jgi:hypothetical protein
MALTSSNAFRIAAGYAKAVASVNDKSELTPIIFLTGTTIAASRNAFNEEIHSLLNISDQILGLAKDSNLKTEEIDAPLENQTYPLSQDLKLAIGDCQKLSLNDLISTLAKRLKLNTDDYVSESESVTIENLASDPIFQTVELYARSLANKFGFDATKPELYAIGALVALNKGDLTHRPALSAHLSAYNREFNAWLKEHGWNDINDLPELSIAEIRIDLDKTHPLNTYQKARNPFIALLNAGIDKVSETRNRECTAYHEAGHAIVSLVLRPKVSLEKVTIVPGETYDGCTFFDDTNPIYKHVFPCTREDFLQDLCVALAGQASQLKKYGFNAADVGAQSDYAGATEYAWQYITEFGLDDAFGPIQLSVLSRKYSIKSGWLFDEAQQRLQSLLKEAQQKTEILLSEHWDSVERVVSGLLERKTLDEDEVRALIYPSNKK